MTLELGFNILLGLLIAAIGFQVKRMFAQLDEQQKTIIDMRVQYQTRVEAREAQQELKEGLSDIRQAIEKLNDKLDRKADK